MEKLRDEVCVSLLLLQFVEEMLSHDNDQKGCLLFVIVHTLYISILFVTYKLLYDYMYW